MFNLLIDHNSLEKARRAVLIAATTTIVIASTGIVGGTLELSGLKFSIEKSHVLITARIFTGYFLYVFIWYCVSNYSDNIGKKLTRSSRARISRSETAARESDNRATESEPEAEHDHDPYFWWIDHQELREREERLIEIIERRQAAISALRIFSLDFLPVTVAGFVATYKPESFALFLYN